MQKVKKNNSNNFSILKNYDLLKLYFLFNVYSGLFEDGQEYQYSYLTFTTTGVRDPTPSGSSFGIRGNLLIQKQAGEAIVKVDIIFKKISLSQNRLSYLTICIVQ
jgi:hypothetical protein